MDIINGYEMTQNFSTQNAGTCMWGFCQKDGYEYFIKKFLSPHYPVDDGKLSPATIEKKIRICQDFYQEKSEFYRALGQCRTGNLVVIQDFFQYGTEFYAVADRVPDVGCPISALAGCTMDQKLTLLRSITYSMGRLHDMGIVHADLKPDNIILVPTAPGYYTGKIIDFDSGFFTGYQSGEVHGDPVYLAPETFLVMDGEGIALTEKLDIFALGILFHQYLTGSCPQVAGDSDYVFEGILSGDPVYLDGRLQPELQNLLSRMLQQDPDQRPGAWEILQELSAIHESILAGYAAYPSGYGGNM